MYDGRALFKIDDGLRVQNALARALALAVVLFDIRDLRVFADVERMDAVVLRSRSRRSCGCRSRPRWSRLRPRRRRSRYRPCRGSRLCVSTTGICTFSPLVQGAIRMSMPSLSVLETICDVLGSSWRYAFCPSERMLTAPCGFARHIRRRSCRMLLLNVVQHIPSTSSRLQPAPCRHRIFG